MKRHDDLTQADVKRELHYDAASGVFTWLLKPRNGKGVVGERAGCQRQGYWSVNVNGRRYLCHRLAWLYVHGYWPPDEVDHIDLDRGNNRISNLRLATRRQNSANRPAVHKGLKGASYRKDYGGFWVGKIRIDGINHHLGCFPTEWEAHLAYCRAANEHWGQFARTG